MDKLASSGDAEKFLQGLGLNVSAGVVRKIVDTLRGESGSTLYALYAYRPGKQPPLCGKGTVYKVKKLIESGKLDPLLRYWGLKQVAEHDPTQLLHLKALKTFLTEDPNIRRSFSADEPSWYMQMLLQCLVRGDPILLPVLSMDWQDLPIISNIRDHCPDHRLWKQIEDWNRKNTEYLDSIVTAGRKLLADWRGGLPFKSSVVIEADQEHDLLLDIFNWSTGQLLGKIPHYGTVYARPEPKKGEADQVFSLCWGSRSYAYGTGEQIECARQLLEDILKRWSNSDEIRSLVYQYQELEGLAQKIRGEIQGIDEETLSQGVCRDCPRLRSEEKARE